MSARLMVSPSWRSRFLSFILKRKFKPLLVPGRLDLKRLRSRLERQASRQKLPNTVTLERVDGDLKGEWQMPVGAQADACILYCHGGGYAFCSPATHRPMTMALAQAAKLPLFSLDYRLTPEHPFPAPVDDALQAYRALLANGYSADRIVLAGDSAGGGLCLALLLKLKALDETLPAGAALLSPWTDMAASGESLVANESSCVMFYADSIRAGAQSYLSGADAKDPLASPLYGDLQGLPPLFIAASDSELLLDDSLRLAERAKAQGGDVELQLWSRQPHVWPTFYPFLPEAKLSIQHMANFTRRCLQKQ